MRRHIAAIPVLTGALFFAAVPALADQAVKTQSDLTFNPNNITILPGNTVTFSNGDGGFHNVAWDDNGVPPTPSSPGPVWNTTPSRTFTVPGVYSFYCQQHGGKGGFGMSGKVTVLQQNGQPPPTVTPDKTAPSIAGLRASAGKKRFTLKFSSSEKGAASGKLERKNSHGVYKKFGDVGFSVKQSSSNSVTIKKTSAGKSLTTGKFRISFRVKDAAGNNSSKRSATVTIAR
jgi:plastocyanin